MKGEEKLDVAALRGQLKVMNELLGRMSLAMKLGQSHSGDRDVYQTLGYEFELDFQKYAGKWARNALARAIINRPVDATWRGDVTLVETDDDEETPFEKAWSELYDALGLKSIFMRLDRLVGLGSYGVLLFGFDDTSSETDFAHPVAAGNRKLLYLKPLSQASAIVESLDEDPKSERYGMPQTYKVKLISGMADDNKHIEVVVHHSRVLHIAEQLMESDIEGTPRLSAVYNNVQDVEKICGGSAEMFWMGARPGYHADVDPEAGISEDEVDKLKMRLDEYEHKLRRWIVTTGMDVKALPMQVADPSKHIDIQIQMISAVTGIPKRILTGSERGELASSQDIESWQGQVTARREEFAAPYIIRPFVDKCVEHSILPTPKEKYKEKFEDLWALSEKDQSEIGKNRAETLQKYGNSGGAQDIFPPNAFYRFCMHLDEGDIELIEEEVEQQMEEEEEDRKKMEESMREAGLEGEHEDVARDEGVPGGPDADAVAP